MSFRDRVKGQGGGGWLNNVDARIVGYSFTIGETKPRKTGKRKGEPFTPLSFVPEFLQEGAEEPVSQRLLIGDAADFGDVEDPTSIVSEDGLTLFTPDGQAIGSEAGTFINSLLDNGFPEDRLDESAEQINLEPIIGTRVQLIQEVNAEKTRISGKQQGKDGKEYDRKDLKVSTVHELPAAKAAAKAGKSAAKPAGKATKVDENARIAAKAAETLGSILADAPDTTIKQSSLSMKVLKALTNDADREAVRKFLNNTDNLEGIEGVTYSAKKGTVSLDS